ncbi:protein of unknown function [Dyadobacter sp. SG02]|uniref:DUF5053 domain-containing protein n=1 Tax=Dyadobacter sp. SG02 TaxID=1855291 RepID=UPI0008D25BD6|nr:DUF5053 domain-containing protein [Dyadobacter sp. SG02]SEI39512.1 protein of unknown function [Dyadobacter sp. SG02]
MKKGLRKFVKIDDGSGRKLLLRTQFPAYIFEIKPGKLDGSEFHGEHLGYYRDHVILMVKDLHQQGEPDNSYFKEAIRYYFEDILPHQPVAEDEIQHWAESTREVDFRQLFELLNGAFVAADCFGKTRQWLHQRINGYIVNGKPAEFTAEQKRQFADYLRTKASELLGAADQLAEGKTETSRYIKKPQSSDIEDALFWYRSKVIKEVQKSDAWEPELENAIFAVPLSGAR